MEKIGFDCVPAGWYSLLDTFYDEINALVECDPTYYKGLTVWKVEKKYCEMVIYLSWYDTTLERLLNKYQWLSESTCEICGDPGDERLDRVLCQRCQP